MTPGGEISSCPAASAQQDEGTLFIKELGSFLGSRGVGCYITLCPLTADPTGLAPPGRVFQWRVMRKTWGGSGGWTTMGFPSSPEKASSWPCLPMPNQSFKIHSCHGCLSCPEQGRSNYTHSASETSTWSK